MITKNKHNKTIATVTAILLIIALLLTGTYAWQSISQQALNQAIGKAAPAGGRLHDDFEVMGENYGEKEWRKDVSANKDIYVENFEDQDGRDIFLRVKLYEYMEVGQGAHLHLGETGFDARAALPLITGANREDVTTWSPRLPGEDANSNLFREYWDWNMGGQKDYMPTFNKDPMSKESDVKGHAVDPQALQNGELPNTTRRDTNPMGIHAYPEAAGLHDYFTTNSTKEAQVKYWDWNLNNDDGGHAMTTTTQEHTARPTLNASIVLMADWDGTIGNFWVLDEDGWCYWAAPLAPETATGLLLNSITLIQVPDQEWYYGIYVDAQMATADEINPAFYGDSAQEPTFEAKDLLNVITGTPAIALMRQVAHTTTTDGMFMESSVRNDAVRTFEVLDLNLNRIGNEAALVESFNAGGGFRGVQLAGAKDLTHADSESKVFLFWDTDNNFYLTGNGGVHATGSLGNIFRQAASMTSADLILLDTSRVTHMGTMFLNASSLTSLNLSSFDTSNVIAMHSMFNNTSALTTLDLSGWDTSNVTHMYEMFRGTGLTTLDLSGWDTSKVIEMHGMFRGTTALQTVDFRHATFNTVTQASEMFLNSGIETIIVRDQDAADFIDVAPGWTRVPPRTIEIVNQ